MSTMQGRSQIGKDGTLRIVLSASCANRDVEYVLEHHAPGTNGAVTPIGERRRRPGEERRASLRRLVGSIDDPTFARPPHGTPERRSAPTIS